MTALLDTAQAYRLRDLHPIPERPNSKLPSEPGWQKTVGRPLDELRAAFEAAGPDAGIGTVTGEGFIVIDLDVRPDVNGIEALATLPWLPPTLTSLTPSGGRHLFFRIPAGTVIKNSVSKVAPGIDIRGQGGQVVLPPTTLDGRQYLWAPGQPDVMADLPAPWLELLAGPPAEAPSQVLAVIPNPTDPERDARRRAAYMAKLNERSVQGNGGNAVMMSAVCHAKRFSRSEDDALAAMLEWSERLADPPWSEQELRRAIANSEAVLGAALDQEESPADAPVTVEAEGAQIAWVEAMQSWVARTPDRRSWALENPLKEKAAERSLMRGGLTASQAQDAMRLAPSSPLPNVYGVDCRPGAAAVFRDEHGNLTLNNWVPPTVKPVEQPFPVLDEVLCFLTAHDKDAKRWLVNWLAFAVQNPARQMRTAPVLYGAQRTGKSLLARAMSELLGPDNCAAIRNEDIKGRFNSHYVTKLFVTVGEIETAEVAHATATLKWLTGEPMLTAEAKNATPFKVANRVKLLATSNQTLPVTLEGEADTRWVLFKQLAPPQPDYASRMDSLFDQATNAWSGKGRAELAGLLYYLRAFDVDVGLARSVLRNAAREAAVEGCKPSVALFCDAVDDAGSLDALWAQAVPDHDRARPIWKKLDINPRGHGRKGLVEVAALHALYVAWARTNGQTMVTGPGRFPEELQRHRPSWLMHRGADRVNVYGDDGARRKVVCVEGVPRNTAARPSPYNAPFFREPGDPPSEEADVPEAALQVPLAGMHAILGRRALEARA